VSSTDARRYLDVIADRAATRQNGARWQRTTFSEFRKGLAPEAASAALVARYIENAATDAPVHTWTF
jgi:hypothetical protein